MASSDRHKLVGELHWSDAKQMYVHGFYDRIAVAGKSLMLLSFVGPASNAKAMRAGLASPTAQRHPLSLTGELPGGLNDIYAHEKGYSCHAHRMPFGFVHALFVSREPSLLMNATDDTLWAALKHTRYNTPLLRSWMPYLKECLERETNGHSRLFNCKAVACECRMLTAMNKDLDDIVSEGLRSGNIFIRDESAA